MEKKMSINDELQAIQSEKLKCSPEKLAACVNYCQRRLAMLRNALERQITLAAYIAQAQANVRKFSDFLDWAKSQGVDTAQPTGDV